MAWQLTGTYFESCSCDAVCPCTWSALTAKATPQRRHAIRDHRQLRTTRAARRTTPTQNGTTTPSTRVRYVSPPATPERAITVRKRKVPTSSVSSFALSAIPVANLRGGRMGGRMTARQS